MGEVIQFIPKPNPNRKPLEQQAAEILGQIQPLGEPFSTILHENLPELYIRDGMKFEAPPEDCA